MPTAFRLRKPVAPSFLLLRFRGIQRWKVTYGASVCGHQCGMDQRRQHPHRQLGHHYGCSPHARSEASQPSCLLRDQRPHPTSVHDYLPDVFPLTDLISEGSAYHSTLNVSLIPAIASNPAAKFRIFRPPALHTRPARTSSSVRSSPRTGRSPTRKTRPSARSATAGPSSPSRTTSARSRPPPPPSSTRSATSATRPSGTSS